VCACVFDLRKRGVSKKSRVAFVARTEPSTLVLFLALFRIGAASCPISFRFPEERVQELLKHLEPAFFLETATLSLNGPQDSFCEIEEDSLAVLMPTSGSLGSPKIVALTYGNLFWSAQGSLQLLPIEEQDRILLSLPLFHVSGLMLCMRALMKKACLVFSSLEALHTHQIQFLSLVPTQLFRVCKHPAPSTLKGVLMGGAPLSFSLWKEATEKGYPLLTSYGLTETCSQVTLDLSPSYVDGRITSGSPLPFRELQLACDGEILVKGKTLFSGYRKQDQMEKEWFATNDLGKWTPDGKLLVLGRKDSQFISGGENIFPEEIEAALLRLPEMMQALVVPVSDVEFGMRPCAFVQTRNSFDELNILAQLRETLPAFMLPCKILPFPKEEGIKFSRRALSQLAEAAVKP
jgi:O-succinylbenzoic acid--CoA ligase